MQTQTEPPIGRQLLTPKLIVRNTARVVYPKNCLKCGRNSGLTTATKNNNHDLRKKAGNVFADIGFANPERADVKVRLTLQIYRITKSRGLTQVESGVILGIERPTTWSTKKRRKPISTSFARSSKSQRKCPSSAPTISASQRKRTAS